MFDQLKVLAWGQWRDDIDAPVVSELGLSAQSGLSTGIQKAAVVPAEQTFAAIAKAKGLKMEMMQTFVTSATCTPMSAVNAYRVSRRSDCPSFECLSGDA